MSDKKDYVQEFELRLKEYIGLLAAESLDDIHKQNSTYMAQLKMNKFPEIRTNYLTTSDRPVVTVSFTLE